MTTYFFKQNDLINQQYLVKFPLSLHEDYQTYRVQTNEHKTQILRIFNHEKAMKYVSPSLFLLQHPNVEKITQSGEIYHENQAYPFLLTDFYAGESLKSKITREKTLGSVRAINLMLGILNGLKYLAKQQLSILPDELHAENILVQQTKTTEIAKLIRLNFILTENSDNFTALSISLGKLFYFMLTAEYYTTYSELQGNSFINRKLIIVLERLLGVSKLAPFKNIDEIILALNADLFDYEDYKNEPKFTPSITSNNKANNPNKKYGFEAIAGMAKLKEMIKLDVIDALNNKEKYEKYGLSIPNGILLYGPPGCGKTFFAEKMAEEIGFKFYQLKPSDIQSKWVNASQENVKALFKEAEENAPSILFIDELDAIVPSRDSDNISHMNTAVVNEFLAQMNNCGERNIFIIGATNRPDAIDTAILRTGRLDKHIFLPLPDREARINLFEIYLKNRPLEKQIDYALLAEKTDNYTASDIKFICDEAARQALKTDTMLNLKLLLNTIEAVQPSLSQAEIEKYQDIEAKFNSKSTQNKETKIFGF
ncbi:AAA family ATPase [Lonepinella sp. BR2357]|uniref:AAA family ATPase n=1 Tax=Lonepinella sp. BR2357 TaxID=3434549 RepID=UPI003F6DEF4F